MPYQEIQALGFPNSPRKLGLYEKPWACISWYGPCTQLVNSKYISGVSVVGLVIVGNLLYNICKNPKQNLIDVPPPSKVSHVNTKIELERYTYIHMCV